eukprot:s2662_g1.t1
MRAQVSNESRNYNILACREFSTAWRISGTSSWCQSLSRPPRSWTSCRIPSFVGTAFPRLVWHIYSGRLVAQ